ncbi:hypothetical protein ZWY2020_004484 [Hordeum vulgare]|nr:hypothetical protein ZWY2020_004484 [Hordeum vulgare]
MAAVRCAARRLGGALLQRTQAEEARLLAPSRLMRSRHLSTKLKRSGQHRRSSKAANMSLLLIKTFDPTKVLHLLRLPHIVVHRRQQCGSDMSPSYILFQTLVPLFWTLICMISMELTSCVVFRIALVLFCAK